MTGWTDYPKPMQTELKEYPPKMKVDMTPYSLFKKRIGKMRRNSRYKCLNVQACESRNISVSNFSIGNHTVCYV